LFVEDRLSEFGADECDFEFIVGQLAQAVF